MFRETFEELISIIDSRINRDIGPMCSSERCLKKVRAGLAPARSWGPAWAAQVTLSWDITGQLGTPGSAPK